jgi:hypothetical protein
MRTQSDEPFFFAQDVGCFGLTELGYGNNAVEMETTATYDVDKKGQPSL